MFSLATQQQLFFKVCLEEVSDNYKECGEQYALTGRIQVLKLFPNNSCEFPWAVCVCVRTHFL